MPRIKCWNTQTDAKTHQLPVNQPAVLAVSVLGSPPKLTSWLWIVNSKQDGPSCMSVSLSLTLSLSVCVWGCKERRRQPLWREWAHAEGASPAVAAVRFEWPQDASCLCVSVCLSMCVAPSPHTHADTHRKPPRHSPQPQASFLPFVKPARQTSSSWAHKPIAYECVLSSLLGPSANTHSLDHRPLIKRLFYFQFSFSARRGGLQAAQTGTNLNTQPVTH